MYNNYIIKNNYTETQPSIQDTISFLEELNLPPLAVSPIQDDEKYYKRDKNGDVIYNKETGEPELLFPGKNPSYLDNNNKPGFIYHSNYKDKFPSKHELKKWFSNPLNGIGTLGGINNYIFIDFDTKHFESIEAFEARVGQWFNEYPAMKTTWIEKTHSGGYRVVVQVKEIGEERFTNFSLDSQHKHHVGEALGEGRFTVLAPTIGPSGNPYEVIQRVKPIEVDSLESIGIHRFSTSDSTKKNYSPITKTSKTNQSTNNTSALSLRKLINTEAQEILEGDYETEDRSEALTKFSKECLGWENWAEINNIPIFSNAKDLVYEAANNIGLDSDRVERTLRGIEKKGLTPAAHYEGGDVSCWKKIYGLDKELYEKLCPDDINQIIKQDFQEYHESKNCRNVDENVDKCLQLEAISDKDCRHVDIVDSTLENEDSEELGNSIKELQFIRATSLDLENYLHSHIAVPLKQVAEAMPTSPEMLLTTLLAVTASLVGTSSSIQAWEGWKENSILWTINIAPTGSMKTPTQDVIMKPLFDLQRDSRESNLHDDSSARDYIVSDFTMEALMQVHNDNPRGLLAYRDEIDGLFLSMNKYRSGKGDDEQNWLSLNSGKQVIINRVDRTKDLQIYATAISITGSIQPGTLEKHLNSSNDLSGWNSRHLYCYPEMPSPKYTDKTVPDISLTLKLIYKELGDFEGDIFSLTEEARDYFVNQYYNPLVDVCEEESHEGMKGVLSKSRGYCLRIALILHCINNICDSLESKKELVIPKEVSLDTIQKAVDLSRYYIKQAKLVYGLVSNTQENTLPKVVHKLIELSKKKGWLTGRVAKQNMRLVKSVDEARKLFNQLVDMGIGEIQGEDKSLKWRYTD